MRKNNGFLVLIGLLLIVGIASAAYPQTLPIINVTPPGPLTVTPSTSVPWVVANGTDTSIITVHVMNTSSSAPLPGAIVLFTVANDPYGLIVAPSNETTDASGNAQCTFKTKTISGVARIRADVTYPDVSGNYYHATTYIDQNIDHDLAYVARFSYPVDGTVGTTVLFNVSIVDYWNNPIDDRRGPHTVKLADYSPDPHDGSIVSGPLFLQNLTTNLDSGGNLSLTIKMSSTYGPNNIILYGFDRLSDQFETITAVTTSPPISISSEIDPSGVPPSLAINQKFTIKYTVIDKFGNPTDGQWVWINTSVPGEEQEYQSNAQGLIWLQYSEPTTGLYTITASSVANSSVNITDVVRFYNTSATSFVVGANPETMASHDANPLASSLIRAKVVDDGGNPVSNETVTFSVNSISYPGGPYNATGLPTISSAVAQTDGNGFATVTFTPGSFSTNIHDFHYSPTSTGTCMVTAVWDGIPQNVALVWKNYPYLSVVSNVTPQRVAVNDTVDVTLKLIGDGYALEKKPIDVILTNDRSGSMVCDNPDRSYAVRKASENFVNNMSTKDQVGLISFGGSGYTTAAATSGCTNQNVDNTYLSSRTYADYATLDKSLTDYTGYTGVNAELEKMIPGGNTPERYALKTAIDQMKASGRTDSVRAIILLTDGDYNIWGDPLARGTVYPTSTYSATGSHYSGGMTNDAVKFTDLTTAEQNLSTYANENNVRIYTIAFGTGLSSGAVTTLQNLATTTGGKYYTASVTNVEDVYRQIAGDLQTDAGVDTSVSMDFGTITVNNVSVNGNTVFNYVPDPAFPNVTPLKSPGSTWVYKFNVTPAGTQYTVTPATVTDQSSNWTTYQRLDFNVGTVKLNETWETNFRLKVLTDGSINVFGPNSKIHFNDTLNTGVTSLDLPPAIIASVRNMNYTGMTEKSLYLDNMFCTNPGEITSLLPVQWNTTYNGVSVVNEQIFYSIDNGPWTQYDEVNNIPPGETTSTSQLDVTNKPAGSYRIRVDAFAVDAPGDTIISDPKDVGGRGRKFIKLE